MRISSLDKTTDKHVWKLKTPKWKQKNRTGLTFCVAGRQLGPGFLTPHDPGLLSRGTDKLCSRAGK